MCYGDIYTVCLVLVRLNAGSCLSGNERTGSNIKGFSLVIFIEPS